jgi:DNA-binding transcriptional regulator YiaG
MELNMRGYSQHIVEANQLADPSKVGVMLGKLCIAKKIPATLVAEELEISKQSVYDWFSGRANPTKDKESLIVQLIQKLTEVN